MSEHGTITNSGRYPPIISGTGNPNNIDPIFAYADAKHEQPFDIVPLLFEGANTLHIRDSVAEAWGIVEKGYGKIYYRVYRLLNRLEKAGIVIKKRAVLFLGMDAPPQNFWRLALKRCNLIRQVQISNPQEKAQIPPGTSAKSSDKWHWARFPKRTNPLRIDACKMMYDTKTRENLWMWQREQKTDPIRPELQEILDKFKKPFQRYIDEIHDKAIVLCPFGRADKIDQDILKLIPYRTRFTDKFRQLTNLDSYDGTWETSKRYYKNAVFVTLTTAPGMHENLWLADRHFAVAWNRYMSLLTKRNIKAAKRAGQYDKKHSYRPKYLCVYEFQHNGLLHCHAILFGIDRIANDKQISFDWERCGQGKITKQIPLVNKNNTWGWKHEKPKDAGKDETPEKYLRKYLQKAIHDHVDFELYWAVNKKFFSKSRSIIPNDHPDAKNKKTKAQRIKIPPMWEFLGTISGGIFPQWLIQKFRVYTPRDNKNVSSPKPKPIILDSTPSAPTDPLDPPMSDHEKQYLDLLKRETEWMEEKRWRLKKRSG